MDNRKTEEATTTTSRPRRQPMPKIEGPCGCIYPPGVVVGQPLRLTRATYTPDELDDDETT